MRIDNMKQLCAARMDELHRQRQALACRLRDSEQGGTPLPDVDRLELSRELSAIEGAYEEAREAMEGMNAAEAVRRNAQAAGEQAEAAAESAAELGKILEIYRRIASGGEVPAGDEQKLMEFSHEMYMAAKSAAMLKEGEGEKYDSLWKNEEDAREEGGAKALSGGQPAAPAVEALPAQASAPAVEEGA